MPIQKKLQHSPAQNAKQTRSSNKYKVLINHIRCVISWIHVVRFVNEKDFYVKIVLCNLIIINVIKPKTYLSTSPLSKKPHRHNSEMRIFLATLQRPRKLQRIRKIHHDHMDLCFKKQSCGQDLTNNKNNSNKVCYQTSLTRVVTFGSKMVSPPNKPGSQTFYTSKFYCYLSKMCLWDRKMRLGRRAGSIGTGLNIHRVQSANGRRSMSMT